MRRQGRRAAGTRHAEPMLQISTVVGHDFGLESFLCPPVPRLQKLFAVSLITRSPTFHFRGNQPSRHCTPLTVKLRHRQFFPLAKIASHRRQISSATTSRTAPDEQVAQRHDSEGTLEPSIASASFSAFRPRRLETWPCSRTRAGARNSWSTSCRSASKRSSSVSSKTSGERKPCNATVMEANVPQLTRSHQDIVSQGVLEVSDNLLYDVENRRTAFPHGPLDPRLVRFSTAPNRSRKS